MRTPSLDDDGLIAVADALNRHIAAAQVALLDVIAEVDRRGAWRDSGARDLAHWVSIRYGMSWWKADRWIKAAPALLDLPGRGGGARDRHARHRQGGRAVPVRDARDRGASSSNGRADATCATIRRRADLEVRAATDETVEFERNRSLRYWYEDGGRRFGLEASMPSAQGAVVAKALSRAVDQIPVMPAEHDRAYIEARRADALLALCSQRIAVDADADRATVVVHASLEALAGRRNAETEHGAVMPPEALQRLACDARVQVVAEDDAGDAVGFGRTRREPSAAMIRQLRHRDRGCRFPGCGSTAFANAHHIVWWSRGGRPTSRTWCSSAGSTIGSCMSTAGGSSEAPDGRVRWFRRTAPAIGAARSCRLPRVLLDEFVDTG